MQIIILLLVLFSTFSFARNEKHDGVDAVLPKKSREVKTEKKKQPDTSENYSFNQFKPCGDPLPATDKRYLLKRVYIKRGIDVAYAPAKEEDQKAECAIVVLDKQEPTENKIVGTIASHCEDEINGNTETTLLKGSTLGKGFEPNSFYRLIGQEFIKAACAVQPAVRGKEGQKPLVLPQEEHIAVVNKFGVCDNLLYGTSKAEQEQLAQEYNSSNIDMKGARNMDTSDSSSVSSVQAETGPIQPDQAQPTGNSNAGKDIDMSW